MAMFPSATWLEALKNKLNTDAQYAHIARNWEGDMVVQIDPGGGLKEPVIMYLDLWHGKCRDGFILPEDLNKKTVVALRGPYENFVHLLKGEVEPMQALLTRKLNVQGSMTLLMRNVPTVLDFVRCCREVTDGYV